MNIILTHMPRRRIASFYLLTSNDPEDRTGHISFGKINGEEHLDLVNRYRKTRKLTQATQLLFGLIPIRPMAAQDHSYSPEGGEFKLDCSGFEKLPHIGETGSPQKAEGDLAALKNYETTCLLVKTKNQSYLFIHQINIDEDFIFSFLRERLDGTVLLSVLSAGSFTVETPLTTTVSKIVTA